MMLIGQMTAMGPTSPRILVSCSLFRVGVSVMPQPALCSPGLNFLGYICSYSLFTPTVFWLHNSRQHLIPPAGPRGDWSPGDLCQVMLIIGGPATVMPLTGGTAVDDAGHRGPMAGKAGVPGTCSGPCWAPGKHSRPRQSSWRY